MQQICLASGAMNWEISSLMVCLGETAASAPEDWPDIIASRGHSLAGQPTSLHVLLVHLLAVALAVRSLLSSVLHACKTAMMPACHAVVLPNWEFM